MRVDASGPGWIVPDWRAPPRVRSAFSLRTGGVSAAPFDSLNLGAQVGDTAAAVIENRRRFRQALALPAEPLWLRQQHGTVVVDADRLEAHAAPPQADAAVTRRAGTVLAVLVADCIPVLLARADGSAVAVAHAGWRGLGAGVLEAAVAALRTGAAGSAPACAWLGPSIGPARFEVGEEVRAAFVARDAAAAGAFVANARGRWQCDLQALARRRLDALGVGPVGGAESCTAGHPAQYFSFRRDGATGRMAALVWLQPEAAGA
jgi:purine-nucleoside/S-methyl-5'-thioadenosine phosphorylase / adenosine deaminase